MITLTILILMALVIMLALIIVVGVGRTIILIPYIDILACIAIVALIIRAVVKKKKR